MSLLTNSATSHTFCIVSNVYIKVCDVHNTKFHETLLNKYFNTNSKDSPIYVEHFYSFFETVRTLHGEILCLYWLTDNLGKFTL